MMKKIIKLIFKKLGFTILKNRNVRNSSDTSALSALMRLKHIGMDPKLVIDGGAASGKWTQLCKEVFSQSKYILVEPIPQQIAAIDTKMLNAQDQVMEAVLGSGDKVRFNITEDMDGSGVYGSAANSIEVEVVRLDDLIWPGTFLKLDTHGYEVNIFEGIGDKWQELEGIMVEVYGFHVSPTAVLFHEIAAILEEKGFRLFDLINVMRRPSDGAFWQADAIFIRSSNPIFANKSYA